MLGKGHWLYPVREGFCFTEIAPDFYFQSEFAEHSRGSLA